MVFVHVFILHIDIVISNSEEGRLRATAGLLYHFYLSFFFLVDVLTASKQALYLGHKTLTNKIWGREYSCIGHVGNAGV